MLLHALTDTGSFGLSGNVNQMFWHHPRDGENLICNQALPLNGGLLTTRRQPECIFFILVVGWDQLQQNVWYSFTTWLQFTLLLQPYYPK